MKLKISDTANLLALESNVQQSQSPIFTFYSYKGGVGRSMALVNAAARLARSGRRVLIIDLDLEAPGISYLGIKSKRTTLTNKLRLGLVDAIHCFITDPTKSPLGDPHKINPFDEYIHKVPLSEITPDDADKDTKSNACIYLMPAGQLDDSERYRARLTEIALEDRLEKGEAQPLFRHVKNLLKRSEPPWDYVLIDSRTGMSAEAATAVRTLCDHLVVVMGLNVQNLEGTKSLLKMLVKCGDVPRSLNLVLSPLPVGEEVLAQKRITIAEKSIQDIWPQKLSNAILVPYSPRLALDERIVVARPTNLSLRSAYSILAERLSEARGDTPVSGITEIFKAANQSRWKDAAKILDDLIARYPRNQEFHGALLSALKPFTDDSAALPVFERIGKLRGMPISFVAAIHHSECKRWQKAENLIRELLKRSPNEESLWIFMLMNRIKAMPKGEVQRPNKKFLALINKAVEAVPHSSNVLYFAGWLANGSPEGDRQAKEYFRRAYELDPSDHEGVSRYARFAWHRMKDVKLARELYEASFVGGKSDPEYLRAYAHFLEKYDKDKKRSRQLRRQATALAKRKARSGSKAS